MKIKNYNEEEFNIKNFIKEYKKDLTKYLINRKAITEKIYEVDLKNNEIKEELELETLNTALNKKHIELYLPITTAVYDDMVIINGDEVDLNEGLGAEYVEGLTYMPTYGRMIDIGDLNISINGRVGLIISINEENIILSLAEGKVDKDLNLKQFKSILNAGIVSIEIEKYIYKTCINTK